MTINKRIITEIERIHRGFFTDDFKRYLFEKYSQEPFPHQYSEQDLYSTIQNDILAYEAGKLDTRVKASSDRWREEREYLQNLYVEKCHEVHGREEYIAVLEHLLSRHGLQSPRTKEEVLAEF